MAGTHTLNLPAPYQESVEYGRILLRDGSTATIRLARPEDQNELKEFFMRLSPESRRHRFLSFGIPSDSLVASFCDCSKPQQSLTLLITRIRSGQEAIIGAGTYMSVEGKTAEVAFAVEDALQGQGLGSQLLERLALIAIQNGFLRFWAMTEAGNRSMMNVFRHSGFAIKESVGGGGYVEVDFSVLPTESSVRVSESRDRLFTAASLRPFFKPNAVAVVGASRDSRSIGRRVLDLLTNAGFKGEIYPVNPKAPTIGALKAYPSVADIPQQVDLAVIAVAVDQVLGVVDDCAKRGVRALVVITAGFSEVDAHGKALQKELLDRVRGYGMRMVGPNCMGLLNADPAVSMNASFSPVFPPYGNISMSSQSGALGLAILALATERHLGLSTFVSVGNKADVSSNDLLQYWESDNETSVILLYLESFGNPRRFARIARRVARTKPIVAVKSGRTGAGKRAAGSHTAALASNDTAVDALFLQTGVIRADTLDEMFDIAAAISSQPLLKGRRVGIVTNAGGPGILCADACEAGGLTIPELTPELKQHLRQFLPASASVSNPIDMIASAGPDGYRQTIELLLSSSEIDALVVIYVVISDESPKIAEAIREGVEAAQRRGDDAKPVLACMMAGEELRAALQSSALRIPAYAFPESAAKVLSKVAAYSEWRNQPAGVSPAFDDAHIEDARQIVTEALAGANERWLGIEEVRRVLDAVRIPQAAGAVARTADEAAAIAGNIGFPVAVKLASHTIVHKTDIGALRLNLTTAGAVREAFESIRASLAERNQLQEMDGVLVQAMVSDGVELMIGVADDRLFGPLIAFGLGGIYVEVLADVCFRITPLTDVDAAGMVRGIRGYKLLQGYRGHPPADIPAIQEVLLRISYLVEEIPEIGEIDLNPIFALQPGKGCSVADARIRVRSVKS